MWTTADPHSEDIEVTTYQPAQEVKLDHYAEPSQNVQTFLSSSIAGGNPAEISAVTEPSTSYEPTPGESRPRLKQRKPAHKHFASFPAQPDPEDFVSIKDEPQQPFVATSTEYFTPTSTEKPFHSIRNRLNLRKFGSNSTNAFEVNSAANVYGQRIRARKRPANINGQDEEDQVAVEGPNQPKKSKADQYKKKFRPFFDQLYEQLTGNEQPKLGKEK